MPNTFRIIACSVMIACTLSLPPAYAHRVNVFCWVEGETIHCQSTFSGGNPIRKGKMYIRTPSGKTLLSGETNEQGEFSFPAPAEDQGTLEVTVQAGAAHKGSWPIKSGEYLPENTGEKHETKQPPDKKPGGCVETNIESRLDEDELRTIVREILVKELAPIKKELAELRQDRITLQDIISGLGYILGLMGIALYFKTKRR